MAERVELLFQGSAASAKAAAGETRSALRGVASTAGQTERELGKLSRGALAGSGAFRGLGRSIAFASAGFLGGFGLLAALRGAVSELGNSVKVSGQTTQALRSTGAVAGITARQIDRLAQSLMRKSGVDDEAIKTSENLLLTFTQIRNEAGKGNDIFNQSTRAVLDMSAVIGDLSSNSITLGKALNDPITGMTALRRIGVSFTEQQRDQIKTLMEHGRILEAQKLILAEVTREFGGQAAAQNKATGGYNTLRESVRNLSAELIRGLIPSFRSAVEWAQKQVDEFEHNEQAQAKVRDTAKQVVAVLRDLVGAVRDMLPALRTGVRLLGGMKDTLELLIALKVAAKVREMALAFGLLTGAEAAAGGAAAGAGILGAAGATALLRSRLLLLVKGSPYIIAFELLINKEKLPDWLRNLSDIAGKPGWLLNQLLGGGGKTTPAAGGAGALGRLTSGTPQQRALQAGIVATAKRFGPGSGITYTWGGASPQTGFDCSGYLVFIYAQHGIRIPHNTVAQWNDQNAIHVPPGQEEAGDGIYYESPGAPGAPPRHVGIYIGGNQVIEYYSRGKPAKIIPLTGPGARDDYMGARRWLKISTSGSAGGGTSAPGGGYTPHDPNAFKKAKPLRKSTEIVPATLREDLAKAELTPGTKDDIAALTAIAHFLEARIKVEKNVEKRIQEEQQLADVRGRIADLQKKKKKTTVEDLIPPVLQERLAKAELTKGLKDDLEALTEIEKYLERRLKIEKNIHTRIEIEQQLAATRAQITDIRKQLVAPEKASLLKELLAISATIQRLPPELQAKLAPELSKVGALWAHIVTAKDRAAAVAAIKKLQDDIQRAFDEAGTAADDAFGQVRDTILNAFDQVYAERVRLNRQFGEQQLGRAQTEKKITRARGTIASIEAGGGSDWLTFIKAKGDAVLTAWAAFVAAIRSGDKDEIDRQAGALAEAQNQFESISGNLDDTATAYLNAYQTLIDSTMARDQAALDDYQAAEQAKAAIAKKAIEKGLNKIYSDLRAGKITLEAAEAAINDLLAPFGLSIADLGSMLDTSDLQDALGALTDAINTLAAALGAAPAHPAAAGGEMGTDTGGQGLPRAGGGVQMFATGGRPRGADVIPALLSQDELVLTRGQQVDIAARLAAPTLTRITVNVHVAGHVTAEQDLAAAISEHLRSIYIRQSRTLAGGAAKLFS